MLFGIVLVMRMKTQSYIKKEERRKHHWRGSGSFDSIGQLIVCQFSQLLEAFYFY
jgi:hypothetical protein